MRVPKGYYYKGKSALPPGLTVQEEKILNKAKKWAYHLDLCLFSLCGLRFGWSSIIGLIPAVGDIADMLLALMLFRTCCQIEPPLKSSTRTKMQKNIIIDFVIGLVPFVGDLADAAYKCNTKNVMLLEDELCERGEKRSRQSCQVNADLPLANELDDPTKNLALESEPRLHTRQHGTTRRTKVRRFPQEKGKIWAAKSITVPPPVWIK